MDIRIDTSSAVPPFEQLRTQLIDAIASGALPAGERLPTVRRFAEDLGLAPGTVARAYKELEAAELIETRGRAGSFVSAHGDARERQAQQAAARYAEQIRALRVDPSDAVELVRRALHA